MNSCKTVSPGLFNGPEVGSLRKNTSYCKKLHPVRPGAVWCSAEGLGSCRLHMERGRDFHLRERAANSSG